MNEKTTSLRWTPSFKYEDCTIL